MADIRNLSFDDLPSAQPANAGLTFADLPDASPTVLEKLGRQLGLTARAGIGGIAAIPNMIADPATALVNKAFGTALPIPSQALDRTLSRFLPQPQNATERIAQAGAQAMVPTAASVQLGRVVPALAQLAQYPATQFVSAASGGASSEGAKELGAGPVGQGVAGLAGGIVAPAALLANATAVRSAARVPGAFMAPLTENGRMNTASRALQRAAFGPRAAADNIDNAISYVPGVMPTTAEVANDPGISAIYKTMRNQNPAVFAARDQANDASRQAFLNQTFGNQTNIAAAQATRDATTGPMRDQAFAAAGPIWGLPPAQVNTAPIVQAGQAALDAGAKYRGSGPMIQKFVNDISQITDPQVLYNGPRKAINDAINGKLSQDNPLTQFTKGELIALRGAIDTQIENVAPGFRNYLQTHAALSRPIDALQLGQDITRGATNPLTERLSPAQFARQISNNEEEVAAAGARASDVLTRVNEDLKRSVAPLNAMRTSGSDTTQNLVGAQMLQRLFGSGAMSGTPGRLAGRAIGWLYSPLEQQTQQLLLNGLLDPQVGAAMLRRPIPQKPDLTAGLLAQMLPISYGGLLGTMSAQ